MVVSVLVRVNGIRWMEYKLQVLNWISKNYGFLMVFFSNLIKDIIYLSGERAKFKGMYLKYRNVKYSLYVEYFIEVLILVVEFSFYF